MQRKSRFLRKEVHILHYNKILNKQQRRIAILIR